MTDDLMATLLVVVLVLALVLAGAVVALGARLGRLRRDQQRALAGGAREDLFAAVRHQAEEIEALRTDVGVVHKNTELLRDLLRDTTSRVGVVRYDAFEDMGGALSFSAAMLDEHGNGLVLSAINGRTETRAYAKAVVAGASEHHLSGEEIAAIRQAMEGPRGGDARGRQGGRRGGRSG